MRNNNDLNDMLHITLNRYYSLVSEVYKKVDIYKTKEQVKTEVITELLGVIKEDLEEIDK